jgi:hypothetical protein
MYKQVGKAQIYNLYLLANTNNQRPCHGIGTNGSCNTFMSIEIFCCGILRLKQC